MKCVNIYTCSTSHWDAVYFCRISKLINNMTTRFYKKTGNLRLNVILRPVRVNTVPTEKQKILHISSMCLQLSLSCLQSAWAILYWHICPFRRQHIIPHYLF